MDVREKNEFCSQPEVAGDAISGVVVDCVGVDVRAKCGDSRLNSGPINRLFVLPDAFYAHLCSI